VALLFHELRYIPEGCGFDSRRCHWNFSLTYSFRPHCGPGVNSASKRNKYQEYFLRGKGGRCVGLTTLASSCADCLEIWEPQLPGILRTCPGLYRRLLYFFEARGEVAGYGTMLQAGRSRVRFPFASLEFFIYILIPTALWPFVRLSL
jgi:hypothetical protein